MALSTDLIAAFVKTTNDTKTEDKETTLYGTAVKVGDTLYARLDGSDQLTPITYTANIKEGERVTVLLKNHSAIATGNVSSPSVGDDEISEVNNQITATNNLIQAVNNDITAIDNDILAQNNTISLQSSKIEAIESTVNTQNSTIETLNSTVSTLDSTVSTQGSKIETLDSTVSTNSSNIETLNSKVSTLDSTVTTQGSTISTIDSTVQTQQSSIDIYNSSFKITNGQVTGIKSITGTDYIETSDLEADHATIASLDTKYAQIDFANINMAAVSALFTKSGIIQDLVVGDTSVTGQLVGVTIKGDLIEGGTVVADKLVIAGTDGLYYKLNTDGVTTTAEQTEYNSLNGSVITAKSITAEKVNVNDLVAFGATIGGFHITDYSLYSGVKESVANTTQGIYMDSTGQISIGDSDSYIRYYLDTSDNTYKLDISAAAITLGSGTNLAEKIAEIEENVTTSLYITSSNGLLFKSNNITTILQVTIYRGATRITDMTSLKAYMGSDVSLQWSFKRMDEDTEYLIDSSDTRISNDGFMLTISADDIDAKATFYCQLIEGGEE